MAKKTKPKPTDISSALRERGKTLGGTMRTTYVPVGKNK